jgi:NTE family protein
MSIEPSSNQQLSESPAPTGQVRQEIEAARPARRAGIALCLSGGGFRAALFHLGALRRLNEVGLLRQVKTVSSVSGGSIMAAHLAACLSRNAEQVHADWENAVAVPLRAFTTRNIRTGPILRQWLGLDGAAGVKSLAARYEKDLTGLRLRDLPKQPDFVFCATDMAYGVNWIFTRERVGDYQAGYAAPPEDWTVGRAVAASSCFPPVFNPLPVGLTPEQLKGGADRSAERAQRVRHLRLTDGGVYDNLGLEPVWKTHEAVLVSDGGAPFAFAGDGSWWWRVQRYAGILGEQAGALRRRWLVAGLNTNRLQGAYWGINGAAQFPAGTVKQLYDQALVGEVIARVRTDLDAFSAAEQAVLENHGYLRAAAALERRWQAFGLAAVPLQIPHPEWMEPSAVRAALRESAKRKALGRWR